MSPHLLPLVTAVAVLFPTTASAQMWSDVTDLTIGETAGWSNKVELADVNGDGLVDILFANGGNYSKPGDPEHNRIFLNQGPGKGFVDATTFLLGPAGDLSRVVKVRDLNGDGHADVIIGGAYETQTRLFFGDGVGGLTEMTTTHLPQQVLSVGDLEVGDVDGDGDLDLVFADWGPGDPFVSPGAPVRLWLNDGSGRFTDVTSTHMPAKEIRWSWDLELIDIDNDFDLDIVVSCKVCAGSSLFENDGGKGRFVDVSQRLPQFGNNYEFEPIDINGDGFFDLVTINDGEPDDPFNNLDLREHIFLADGRGGFTDATAAIWPDAANIGADDNAIVVLDFDSDGDPDFLIAALGVDADRLLINEGGRLVLDENVFAGENTPGTLGIAVADLNGDGKLDVVQSQGELADDNRVYFGTDIVVDTAPPVIGTASVKDGVVRVRVHDNKTPVMPHDFQTVELVIERADGSLVLPLSWYGEALWRVDTVLDAGATFTVCATDAAGNRACSKPEVIGDKTDDLGDEGAMAGCTAAPNGGGLSWPMLALLALLFGLAWPLRKRARVRR